MRPVGVGAHILLALLGITALGFSAHCAADELEGYHHTGILRRPHVRVEYYWLDAVDRAGLRTQLGARGPRDLGGVGRDAYVGWKVRWSWSRTETGEYDLAQVKCAYAITVTLPKWRPLGGIERTSPELRERWNSFTRALAEHELGHIEMVERRFDEPCAAIRREASARTLSTEEGHAIAKKALAALRAQDRRYDEITDHGRSQGARL